MCVIFSVNKVRPTDIMIEKAWAQNDDGAGIAWREPAKDGKGLEVVWAKGLDEQEMIDHCKKVPLPYVAHWRIASIGGIRPTLTHPFPVEMTAPLTLNGRTKGSVLFHNGHWDRWHEHCLKAAGMRDDNGRLIKIPTGRWSDSRAMAWLCSIYGPGFMEFLPEQRGVIFSPDEIEIFTGPTGFVKVNDVWCSNDTFMSRSRAHNSGGNGYYGQSCHPGMCRYGACTETEGRDEKGYCPKHKGGILMLPPKVEVVEPHVHKLAGAGGPQQPVVPFPLLAKGQFLTLEMATILHNQRDDRGVRKLSKNKFKDVQRWTAEIEGKNTKRADKAWKELTEFSLSLTSSGPVN